MKNLLEPVSPGEILLNEFLLPLKISQNKLGKDLGVPTTRINEIVNNTRSVTVDTALRLSRYFGTSPEIWLNLQQDYDLEIAKREIKKNIDKSIVPLDSLEKEAA